MKPACFAGLLFGAFAIGQNFPEGRGRAAFERVCATCHPADVVVGMGNTREGWKDLVNEMFLRGGSATKREKAEIIDYLARSFPLPKERRP